MADVNGLRPNRRNVRKGSRVEYECVTLLRDLGFEAARRVPLSGSLAYLSAEFAGDVRGGFKLGNGREFVIQSKGRSGRNGWSQLHQWLDGMDALYLRADRKMPIVVLPWQVFASLLSMVPSENRLPKPTDSLAELRKAAELSPYARNVLTKLEALQAGKDRETMEEAPF
ncbi:MAG: hypothetical protein U0796_14995 [Gemmatales bacterium]